MKYDQWKINHAVRLLEQCGYIVVRPKEVDLPAIVEIQPGEKSFMGQLGVRIDVKHNGGRACVSQYFPAEMACNPDDADFRDNAIPNILSREIGHFLADQILPDVAAQVKEKIKPFIFKKHIGLAEIEGFIAMALDGRYAREDVDAAFPQFRDDANG